MAPLGYISAPTDGDSSCQDDAQMLLPPRDPDGSAERHFSINPSFVLRAVTASAPVTLLQARFIYLRSQLFTVFFMQLIAL